MNWSEISMERIICKKCKLEFAYEFWGTVYPGGKDKEYVVCPYCGETAFTKMSSQNVSIYKIDNNGNINKN